MIKRLSYMSSPRSNSLHDFFWSIASPEAKAEVCKRDQFQNQIFETLSASHGVKLREIFVRTQPPSVCVAKRLFEKLRRDEQITTISFNPTQN